MTSEIRVGQGIDIHPFASGRKCILGGVEIPHDKGLLGHSDADALAHAVTDALLGAAGHSDIGTIFPPEDPQWKDADSMGLLQTVFEKLKKEGWRVVNLDTTVLAEAPKIKPYVSAIRKRLSEVLEIRHDVVAVKATTTEHLGFVGREEGVVAMAVVLITRV